MQFISYDREDEDNKELFESFLCRYQIGLETPIKDSDFVFDYVD